MRQFIFLPLLALAAQIAFCQIGGRGSIQGVVSDPTGAVVPGASVIATEVATGVKTARQTTNSGYYVLAPLPVGTYNVTVAAAGFETVVQQNVVVDALTQVGLNLTLKVGAASEQITITDTPPALNTSDARMGQTIRSEEYTALPLAMGGSSPRDPVAFAQYTPGVTGFGSNTAAGNVYGCRGIAQETYVEGMPMTNAALQGEVRNLGLGVSVEAVEQFQVETAGASPSFSGQGATNFVIKSGTNQFHGSAYEYFRNTVLDARGFFPAVRPVEHTNQFGFTVGGPVIRNRIFFSAATTAIALFKEPSQFRIASLGCRTGGKFLGAAGTHHIIPRPLVAAADLARDSFSGNIIPASRISNASKVFQAPLPPLTNGGLQSNYLGTVPVGYFTNTTTDKVDFNLTDKDRFYVVYSHGHRGQSTDYRGQTLPLPYANTRLVDDSDHRAGQVHAHPQCQPVERSELQLFAAVGPDYQLDDRGQLVCEGRYQGIAGG